MYNGIGLHCLDPNGATSLEALALVAALALPLVGLLVWRFWGARD